MQNLCKPYTNVTIEKAIHSKMLQRMSVTLLLHIYRPVERARLGRRMLEAAHLKYAVFCVTSWYPGDFDHAPEFSPDMDQALLEFIPAYQQAFHKKYSGM